MPIQQLTPEQVQTWTRQQKDRWWFDNVWRGDMPQLTLRSAFIGFMLGGILSATNLYVGAKTGWTLGVGLTSVILAFAMFRVLSRVGVRDLTILENNCSQSIATAAGYMTSPLVAGMAAYMWATNAPINPWHMLAFNVVLSVLGVLVAFPMKRRFINDEQQPFPEGRACGVVLDTLYTSGAASGLFKAKALAVAAGLAGFISFISGESYMKLIQEKWMGFKHALHLPHNLDEWYYALAAKGHVAIPRLAGVDLRQLGLRPELDLAMFGAGGLMGVKVGTSLLVGMLVNFVIVVPWMISIGEIKPQMQQLALFAQDAIPLGSIEVAKITKEGETVFGRAWIMNTWALWWGIAIMVTAAMVSLFAKPQIFVEAFRGFFSKKQAVDLSKDPLHDIELPLWVSWVGVPIVGAVGVWMAHEFFGVSWVLGAISLPLIFLLTLIAVSSTALTGITPGGSLSKIPQFIFGYADPKHPATNLMTGVMCSEVALNASNLLMDIKPGYMLGAKPRQQAIGHCIGIVSGAIASTWLFSVLFLQGYSPEKAAKDPMHVQNLMAPDGGQFSFPGAVQWKGVSDLVTSIFDTANKASLLTDSIVTSMIIAASVGLVFELARIFTKGKFWLSPLAIGLGVVVPPGSTLMMFLGSLFFWLMHKVYHARKQSKGHLLWIETHEPICAGIIAGAALVGIGDTLVKVFLLK